MTSTKSNSTPGLADHHKPADWKDGKLSRRQIIVGAVAGSSLWLAGRTHAQGMGGMMMGSMPGVGLGGMSEHAARGAAVPSGVFARPMPIPGQLGGQALADGSLAYVLRIAPGTSTLLAGVQTPEPLAKLPAAIDPKPHESALRADFCWILAISDGYGGGITRLSCRGR